MPKTRVIVIVVHSTKWGETQLKGLGREFQEETLSLIAVYSQFLDGNDVSFVP